MAARAIIPSLTNDDRIPNECAVWRVGRCEAPSQVAICAEYEGGLIARTYVGQVPDWAKVVRWRYGWPPA